MADRNNADREEDFVEFIWFGIGQKISQPKENASIHSN